MEVAFLKCRWRDLWLKCLDHRLSRTPTKIPVHANNGQNGRTSHSLLEGSNCLEHKNLSPWITQCFSLGLRPSLSGHGPEHAPSSCAHWYGWIMLDQPRFTSWSFSNSNVIGPVGRKTRSGWVPITECSIPEKLFMIKYSLIPITSLQNQRDNPVDAFPKSTNLLLFLWFGLEVNGSMGAVLTMVSGISTWEATR